MRFPGLVLATILALATLYGGGVASHEMLAYFRSLEGGDAALLRNGLAALAAAMCGLAGYRRWKRAAGE